MDWARSGLISAQYGARNDPLHDHDGTGLIEGTILVCFQPIISPGQDWDKNGPVFGRILAQDRAGYGPFSAREWSGLEMG